MPFIDLVTDDAAEGDAAELFAADHERFGYVPNFTLLFANRVAALDQLPKRLGTTLPIR